MVISGHMATMVKGNGWFMVSSGASRLENFSSSAPRFFYTPQKSNFALTKKFGSQKPKFFQWKISVFRNQNWISRQKKNRFIKTEFFMKGKTGNSRGKKEP
jgi:hypothetical protein